LKNYFSKQELVKLNNDLSNKSWNLLSINTQKNSLFQFTRQDDENQISGVTIPWFYFGMLYATFCWHTEDLYLYSLNYMHYGQPKIWYGIPHTQKEKMDNYIKNKYYAILLKQPDLVHYLTVFIDPLELLENGIEVFKAVQNPGEIIITLPEGYHTGFSTGFNIAEAVNFSTLNWLEFGFKALSDYRKIKTKVPVFSIEWIILHNYQLLSKLNFDSKEAKKEFEKYLIQIINEELNFRKIAEINLNEFQINYKMEDINEKVQYYEHECQLCRSHLFLSYLYCNNCKKKICINHMIQCKCLPTDFTLFLRYKNSLDRLVN